MNTIYLICGVIILTLFYCHHKRRRLNREQINPEIVKEVNPENQNQIITDTAIEIKPEMATKNKWLYPADEFGKMEKGVVSESITYVNELNENNRNDLVILTEKKTCETEEV
ncbi:hypothetical protein [Flavobacterium sp. GSP6]|uniref:hypothetical protein n=1 Tax=Flavobacterium sp. GSP6 TaxID=2497488 RepID=UPI000F8680C2|nr:hypothetical protein [Flavobacterium sp. GSP6]RTZ05709.1 hypothetical protein EKM03_07785 [Flavobacterium sp. GSP6]